MKARRRLLLVLGSIIFAFLVSEISLRVAAMLSRSVRTLLTVSSLESTYEDVETVEALFERTMLGFRPNWKYAGFVSNSKGFRTREYSPQREPETLRIVVLGDSFAFDSGRVSYRSLWPAHLEELLSARSLVDVEVLNLGIAAASLKVEERLWLIEGAHLGAQFVVLALFVGNDFYEDYPLTPGHSTILQYSFAARLARNVARYLSTRAEAAPGNQTEMPRESKGGFALDDHYQTPEKGWLGHDQFMRVETERIQVCLRDCALFEGQFAWVTGILGELNRQVEETGAKLVVMLIPDEFQVNPQLRAEILASLNQSDADYDLGRPQRRLREFLDAAGILHLDLLPDFRDISRHEVLYIPEDTHWNDRGNELAAQLLAEHLAAVQQRVPVVPLREQKVR